MVLSFFSFFLRRCFILFFLDSFDLTFFLPSFFPLPSFPPFDTLYFLPNIPLLSFLPLSFSSSTFVLPQYLSIAFPFLPFSSFIFSTIFPSFRFSLFSFLLPLSYFLIYFFRYPSLLSFYSSSLFSSTNEYILFFLSIRLWFRPGYPEDDLTHTHPLTHTPPHTHQVK